MKNKVLSLILMMGMLLVPFQVSAAGATVFGSDDENMTNTTMDGKSITCPKVGNIATCYIGVKVTTGTATSLTIDATLTNMTYDSNSTLNGWTLKSPTQSGNKITYEFTNKNGTAAGKTILIAKITYKVANVADTCSIKITTASTPEVPVVPKSCEVIDNKYYCKDGVVCEKVQYDKECTPENPQTGSFLPYFVVIAGLGVAGALFIATRKKAKIYHV